MPIICFRDNNLVMAMEFSGNIILYQIVQDDSLSHFKEFMKMESPMLCYGMSSFVWLSVVCLGYEPTNTIFFSQEFISLRTCILFYVWHAFLSGMQRTLIYFTLYFNQPKMVFSNISHKKSQLTQPKAFDPIRSWSKLIVITLLLQWNFHYRIIETMTTVSLNRVVP